jgi:hypothetical protein
MLFSIPSTSLASIVKRQVAINQASKSIRLNQIITPPRYNPKKIKQGHKEDPAPAVKQEPGPYYF